jgi:hypothetical protein
MFGFKFALQAIAMVAVMFVNIDLATTGRPIEAVVITVAVVFIGPHETITRNFNEIKKSPHMAGFFVSADDAVSDFSPAPRAARPASSVHRSPAETASSLRGQPPSHQA